MDKDLFPMALKRRANNYNIKKDSNGTDRGTSGGGRFRFIEDNNNSSSGIDVPSHVTTATTTATKTDRSRSNDDDAKGGARAKN